MDFNCYSGIIGLKEGEVGFIYKVPEDGIKVMVTGKDGIEVGDRYDNPIMIFCRVIISCGDIIDNGTGERYGIGAEG